MTWPLNLFRGTTDILKNLSSKSFGETRERFRCELFSTPFSLWIDKARIVPIMSGTASDGSLLLDELSELNLCDVMASGWPPLHSQTLGTWSEFPLPETLSSWSERLLLLGHCKGRGGGFHYGVRKTHQGMHPPEKIWTPPNDPSLLSLGFLSRKTEHKANETPLEGGVENILDEGLVQQPFFRGCPSWAFPAPSFSIPHGVLWLYRENTWTAC